MNLFASVESALLALALHKLRSGLTMLGIIIGISAVIVLVSVGQGVQTMVAEQMQSVGSNIMFVMPGQLEQSNASMKSNFLRSANTSSLTLGDVAAVSDPANVPALQAVAPEFVGTGSVTFQGKNMQTTISGVTPAHPDVLSFYPVMGRFVQDSDLRTDSRVAVIGQTVLGELFTPGQNPIGQILKINRVPFRIVGVMEEKGGNAFSDEDQVVFVPLTTAQSRLFGGRDVSGDYTVSVIYARAADESLMDEASEQIRLVLRQQHGLIYSTDEDDFSILTQEDVSAVLGSLTAVLTMFLGLISAVSLLVGGIGVMNIMLVSVTERTREIGIRKAVGARRRDILLQFLIEAVVLSLIGGLVGIALGVSGAVIAGYTVEDLRTHISATTVLLAAGVSIGVGLSFGIFPAMRAARLNPIEALRYE
ncbi:MAG: ABC transporter permease [Anaerolineae bacterium]|nr:ABC transporter permease [Anaerolineae bacterium]